MKHESGLMQLLLLDVRDGGLKEQIDRYPEPLVLDQCAYLIDGQYVDGQYLLDCSGKIANVVLTRLLPKGHAYLRELEGVDQGNREKGATSSTKLRIFLSHSSADSDLAAGIVDLLRDALALKPQEIRCTSVDGYRLPSGVETNGKLREEIEQSETFVALLTPGSIRSTYVLFELGARWGRKAHWALLMGKGLKPSDLQEPLRSHNTLSVSVEAQVDQFVEDLATRLQVSPCSRAAWGAKARRVTNLSFPMEANHD